MDEKQWESLLFISYVWIKFSDKHIGFCKIKMKFLPWIDLTFRKLSFTIQAAYVAIRTIFLFDTKPLVTPLITIYYCLTNNETFPWITWATIDNTYLWTFNGWTRIRMRESIANEKTRLYRKEENERKKEMKDWYKLTTGDRHDAGVHVVLLVTFILAVTVNTVEFVDSVGPSAE